MRKKLANSKRKVRQKWPKLFTNIEKDVRGVWLQNKEI